jgi:2-dehydro-3-deoxygluconokinase
MKTKKLLTLGEIMMRLSAPGHARFSQARNLNIHFGGAEANVAVAMAGFGIQSEHITRFPDDDLGKAATNELKSKNVSTQNILYGPGRLGLYFLENGAAQRPPKIIYDRFNSAFSFIQPGMFDWDALMKSSSWFHWTGITPAISEGAARVCLEALEAARRHGVLVSGDINYRRNLWQYGKSAKDIMPGLIELTDHIVGDISDFENCTGISGNDFTHAADIVMKNFKRIRSISKTHRETVSASHNILSASIWDGKKLFTSKAYDIYPIVDRIGTGDAFMAGLIYGWMTTGDLQWTVDFASASGAWKHSVEGDSNSATVGEIESSMKGENVGKLLR